MRYVARDQLGQLHGFDYYPQRDRTDALMGYWRAVKGNIYQLDNRLFPSVRWDGKPKAIEIKLGK